MCLTSVFGKGTGGATRASSPDEEERVPSRPQNLTGRRCRHLTSFQSQALGVLVPGRSTRRRASTPGLSSSCSSSRLPGSLPGGPHLGAGFALRCFQRLSLPDAAFRPHGWRHDRYTVGPSTPVLSYWERPPSGPLRPRWIWTELSHDVLNPAHVPL